MSSEKALGLTLRDEFGSRRQLLAGVRLWPEGAALKRPLLAESSRSRTSAPGQSLPVTEGLQSVNGTTQITD